MELTPEVIARISATPFEKMVTDLAKPGEAILNSMTFEGFSELSAICGRVVVAGDKLDIEKKVFIYGKDRCEVETVPALPVFDLQSAFLSLTAEKLHLLHMAIGLAGEAAEMLAQACSHVFGDAELDFENVEEEGGDALFYIEGLAQGTGMTLEAMKDANKVKLLGKRYSSGVYSDAQAIARADKGGV